MKVFGISLVLVASLTFVACADMQKAMQSAKQSMAETKSRDKYVGFRKYEPVGTKTKDFVVETPELSLTYKPTNVEPGFTVNFKNKTSEVVTVLWAESSISSPDQKSMPIATADLPRSKWEQPTPNTQILPNDEAVVFMVAKPLVKMAEGYKVHAYPLCGEPHNVIDNAYMGQYMLHTPIDKDCVGKPISAIITYDVNGAKKKAIIQFKLIGAGA